MASAVKAENAHFQSSGMGFARSKALLRLDFKLRGISRVTKMVFPFDDCETHLDGDAFNGRGQRV